jgi:large subunit ribosomal protein L23
MNLHEVIRNPHITEKATIKKEAENQVTFKVDRRANKVEIRKAVEELLKAKVIKVRTQNMTGKRRRLGRSVGKRPDWKKAVVTLRPGEEVEFFEGM